MKVCPACERDLPLDQFDVRTVAPDEGQPKSWCKECSREASRQSTRRSRRQVEPCDPPSERARPADPVAIRDGKIAPVTTPSETLGALLRRTRQEAGLSLRELAVLLDVSLNSLHYWETGQRFPQPRHERRIVETIALLENKTTRSPV